MTKKWYWPFGSDADAEDKAPTLERSGIFSTDLLMGVKTRNGEGYRRTWNLSFQRDPTNFVAKDSNGAAVAMDSDQLQQMKAGYAFSVATVPELQFAWYASQGFIGYQVCAMIAQHWLVDKACTMPGRDAIRNGYEITVNDGDEMPVPALDYMRQLDEAFKIDNNMVEFLRMGRIFGVRLAMFDINYGNEEETKAAYEAPFNPDGIKPGSYRGISQIDPYWTAPELGMQASSNPAARDFYEPTWWRIGGLRVHKSHFVIFRTCEVPDILKPTYIYGGVPLPQRIMERVYAAERTANEAPMLAMTKRSTILKLANIEAALGDEEAFQAKMDKWISLRDNYQVKVVGGDDAVEQTDTALTDLDAIIMTQYQIVAAIAEVPVTKLLGTTPKGFNATGEFDEASYHESLQSIQTSDLKPLVERHHLCLMRSHVGPKFFKDRKPDQYPSTTVQWNPLDAYTAEEQAAINKTKAETDTMYVNAGAIDGVDVRRRLAADKSSGYAGLGDDTDQDGDQANGGMKWDESAGSLDGAELVTTQEFRDPNIVAQKKAASDFAVQVSPEFMVGGKPYRAILDGHHSFTAANEAGEAPVFEEIGDNQEPAVRILNEGKVASFLAAIRKPNSAPSYFNPMTGEKRFVEKKA